MMPETYKKGWKLIFVMFLMISVIKNEASSSLVLNESRAKIKQKYGSFALARIDAATKLTKKITSMSEKKKLIEVNKFVNQVRFVSDNNVWGVKDYWANPVEFLGKDRGDCEDFAITKYFMLRKANVPSEKLFFTYVKALKLNQAHMVLTYYATPKSIPLVLDNLNFKVLPATMRNDLAFVYSFNAKKLYLNRQKGLGKVVSGRRAKDKKWASFLGKFEKDF